MAKDRLLDRVARRLVGRTGGKCAFAALQHETARCTKADFRRQDLAAVLFPDGSSGYLKFAAGANCCGNRFECTKHFEADLSAKSLAVV